MAHINLIPGEQGVRLSTLSPKYLHTNSTSHTWPFSAVAELIDNAYDPDVDASQLWIDIERYGFEQCLTFTDNGAGMNSLKLHKMLSFGFCEKVAKNDHLPVGHYGNGFKSGSMRLGKDAIVFTKNGDSRSVGFLSQTYLEAVKAQTILVPIVSWDAEKNMVERADGDKALQDILKHSLFKTKSELMAQFSKIKSRSGTRIVISNMRRTQEGKYEFDFRTDYNDIRIPDDIEMESYKYKRQERQNHIPESDYSLRAYCSILYLKPRMQIILRSKKVKTTVIAKSLSKTEVDTYRPQGIAKAIKVTFGFSQNRNHYGIMMYHRNRLIKPYVRVGYQLRANNLGVGVIGVIQCDYLQPTHNKQDFDYTKAYRSSMSALGSKLNDYWNEKKGRAQANSNAIIPEPKEVESVPDQLWVQCDNPECLKWRKLPHGVSSENLPEKWYCTDHPEEKWRSCDVPEELEDEAEEAVQPYVKKQKRRLEKELEEKRRREKEAKKMKELELEVKSRELKKKEAEIKKLIQIVETKSKQQQQQQQQKGPVKKEAASPQKMQIKVVGPALSKQQQTTPTKRIVVQNTTNQKVILTPVSTPTQTFTRTILQKPATAQQSVQIVKVVGGTPSQMTNQKNPVVINLGKVTVTQPGMTPQVSGPSVINLGKVTVAHPGMTPKVSGPPVIFKVNSKAAAEQVKYLPTMVPVTAVVDPKVVSVQSLATNTAVAMPTNLAVMATPGASMVTPGAAMATPGGAMATPRAAMATPRAAMATPGTAMATPGTSMATSMQVNNLSNGQQTKHNYRPLESLKEVNRQATENTVSPVTAVIEDTTPDYTKPISNSVETPKVINPTPLGHQDVTVNNRYRYIAPTGQPVPQGAQSSAAAASSQLIVLQQVKSEPGMVKPEPQSTSTVQQVVKTEPTSPNVSNLKRRRNQSTDTNEPDARKQKTDADVIIIDPPSPPPMRPLSPDRDILGEETDLNVDSNISNMDTSIPNLDTVMKDCKIVNIDKEVVEEVKTLSPKEQLQALLTRTQQLYSLRENVLKLLRVLVPELEVADDLKGKYDDQTVDELLKQVLDQAEKTDTDIDS